MNILYLNHYAGSPQLGMEYRPYYLAREWVRAGHRVQMLAADFSHVRSTQPAAGDAVIDGIDYRFYATPRYAGNGVARVKNIAAFLRAAWADTPRLVRDFNPNVVIASSTYPMDIWVARRMARLSRAKLVFEVHDLWPLSPSNCRACRAGTPLHCCARWPRTRPTATPTWWSACCPRCKATWRRAG